MGIQNFTKLFKPDREITFSKLKGKRIVVDAYPEIYRAALGMKSVDALTDAEGKPTGYINTIVALITDMIFASVYQYWLFDRRDTEEHTDEEFHIKLKKVELRKRNEKRKKEEAKIKVLEKQNLQNLQNLQNVKDENGTDGVKNILREFDNKFAFSSDDENADENDEKNTDTNNNENNKKLLKRNSSGSDIDIDDVIENSLKFENTENTKSSLKSKNAENVKNETKNEEKNLQELIDARKKRIFQIQDFYIAEVKFILNCLNIPWADAPSGFDSEHFASMLTRNDFVASQVCKNMGITKKMDYVLTPDADALLFGAENVLKRDIRNKKIFEYNLQTLLGDNNITFEELIKIGLILGTDFASKTPRIGAGTVLKPVAKSKMKNKAFIESLTKEQRKKDPLRLFDITELTEEQKLAMDEVFLKEMQINDNVEWKNLDKDFAIEKSGVELLLRWRIDVKGFKPENAKKRYDQLFKIANS